MKKTKIEPIAYLNQKTEGFFQIKGTSMLPFLKENTVVKITENIQRLKKYDCILYERATKELVLHRIVKINQQTFTLMGDNLFFKENNIKKSQIIGKLEGFYQNEKYIKVNNQIYRFKVFLHYKRLIQRKIFRKIKRLWTTKI